ncbi:hypothetical protein B296_00008893 [Ensete ventricosum]|uniref:Uncharacterized protein n=1 Tax=Ensete ventricosum TaxID=4639 RepID=A0A426YFK6_ENSVE|nr:hypothetical protein B296_00008893 [Ensete ventricosum]
MHAMGNPAPAIDADPPHEIDRRRFLTLKSHYPSGEARGTLGSSRRRSWSPVENLLAKNLYGDTALHIAAAVGNCETRSHRRTELEAGDTTAQSGVLRASLNVLVPA